MRKKRKITDTQATEDERLTAFMDSVSFREPMIRIYRLEVEGRKQTFLGTECMEDFSLENVRERFGAGTFLLRSVRANGTYGPSRVVSIAPLLPDYRKR